MVFFTTSGSEAVAEGIHRGIAVEIVSQPSQKADSLLRQFVSRFPSAMSVNKEVRYHVWNLWVHPSMAWRQVTLCFTTEAQDGSGSEMVRQMGGDVSISHVSVVCTPAMVNQVSQGVEGRSLDPGGPGLLAAVEPTVVSSRCLGARSSVDLGGSLICTGNAGSLTAIGLLQAVVVLSMGGSVNLQGLHYTYEDEVLPMTESLLQVVSFAVGELIDLLLYGLAIIENFREVRAIVEGSVADCKEIKKFPATDLVDGVLAIGLWFADHQ
ncbi:hypothetical protein NE237_014484 [Protea cynaroides]|uniref:Uncharacterized protein n=1 Tax=Protea cynaroides TaxID=273540 RepID=A0A9Q0QQ62_9MAGN|nr:hypothetical protein NE237_014484 [Protea cynaroides]